MLDSVWAADAMDRSGSWDSSKAFCKRTATRPCDMKLIQRLFNMNAMEMNLRFRPQ